MKPRKADNRGKVIYLDPIRVETELSGFPIHNLKKRGSVDIDIRGTDEAGREIRWTVSPSRRYGEPRELAYKLDTLIINRRIDRAGKAKPKVLALGSLREICRELGLNEGQSVRQVKQALLQNALTGITAKFTYTCADKTERIFEAAFTRYSLVFTGENLPDGRKSDQVYVILNDIFLEVLNNVKTRPLDYKYLKSLSPTPQRFYELVAPQVFAAIKHRLPHAKYPYSEFCICSTQTRYTEREKMRKQMYKVIKPHRDSGYIVSVSFEDTTDEGGVTDWDIVIVPGPKAKEEFQAFTKRTSDRLPKLVSFESTPDDDDGEQLNTQESFSNSFMGELIRTQALTLK